ncbi:MAG: DUF1926 domain-containing protein [Candidatus Omnitrophica bacterium]|nr:DUF1926 domain-containing protein [Candidatus Omnitrophota bacterium]MCM8831883.1 DUF1926 domain-containing protein [Candidatus Omnitrophota bacterium]
MGKVYFLFGVHNHQPVGNFHSIFKKAYQDCYLPFILTLEKFPNVKCCIHNSGPLYDWFLENAPEYIDILKKLTKRGQVEIVSSGYYEPILPLISDEDKYGQINFMNNFVKNTFGVEPKGIWVAERVWEQYLAKIIHDCNLKYTFLDDTHFRYAGLKQKEFFGYYTTEEEAKPIFIFPISKTLRYKIPFSQYYEAIELLNSFASENDVLVTLFDDGEKFGLWPNTFDWVYKNGWLNNFFTALSNSTNIITVTAEEAIQKFSSSGIIYLPTASYEEMGEWVLEPESFLVYERLKNFLKENNKFEEFKDFIRGGFFRNFYHKYSRLNYMHKRMLFLSKKIHSKIDPKNDSQILNNLWKAQTNCSYWHGIFGGFYLGHLRSSVYEHLIKAQTLFEKKYLNKAIEVQRQDIDLCTKEEIFVNNKKAIFCFSQKGGTLLEFSLKDVQYNLLNTVTRQKESYHQKLFTSSNSQEVTTIHHIIKQKEANLHKYLIYDSYQKLGLIDHILDKKISQEDFNQQRGFITLANNFYDFKIKNQDKKVSIDFYCKTRNISFTKTILIKEKAGFDVFYNFDKKNILNTYNFGIEFNLSFASIFDIFAKNKKELSLDKVQVFSSLKNFKILDKFKKLILTFDIDTNANIFSFPMYTVSSSEDGFEKVYQQLCILFIFSPKNKIKLSLNVNLLK